MAVWILFALFFVTVGGMAYVRSVGHDPAVWHVDPTTAERTGRPNDALVLPGGGGAADMASPVFATDPEALARLADNVIMAQPRVERVAGGPDSGFATYVQRSKLMGWPDYVSVKAVPAEGGAALAIWSRSRFGYSDMGVNRARVEDWLAKIEAARG